MTAVLIVVSAADRWTLEDGSEHPTGFWAEELAEPHRIFREAGWSITIATPGGVAPTVDPLSLGLMGGTKGTRERIESYLDAIADELASPVPLDAVDEAAFDLVFYPGGHAPMEDLAVDPVSGALLRERHAAGRPIALVCHAPAAVLAAAEGGVNPFAGYRMTALSNIEERVNAFSWKAKWLLQDALEQAGIDYDKALLPMVAHVVVDRHVFTGQNPKSAGPLAERLVEELGRAHG